MSKKMRIAKSLVGATMLAGLLGGVGGAGATSNVSSRDAQKTKSPRKLRTTDSGARTMVGSKIKMSVDRDASPREIREKADSIKETNKKIRDKVESRRDKGELSPTMPKRKSQISSDFGLDLMGGAKTGKMVRARGGGMARMKPTKLY
tara:strand:- start:45 stop:488 length:444 start_codon:yes stop_codon:yes gene_type:complete